MTKSLRPIAAFFLTLVACSAQTMVPVDSTSHSVGLSTAIRSEARTIQLVYSSSLLGSVPVGASITGISFRLYDAAFGAWPGEELSWENYDIQVSSSLHSPGELSEVFDENIALDFVMARSGTLTLPANSFPGGGSPNDFGVRIGFTNFFVYTGSDLLITIRHNGNGIGDEPLEATEETGGYQSLTAVGYDAVTGTPNVMTIAQLHFSAVPEPSAGLLLMVAFSMLAFRRAVPARTIAKPASGIPHF